MSLKSVYGNLLDCPSPVICHQLNCVTNHAKGLAKGVFTTFPYANVYATNIHDRTLGEIIVCAPPESTPGPTVIGLCAQHYPGKPRSKNQRIVREKAFAQCLEKLGDWLREKNIDKVGFPYEIGCGLAGGNWETYARLIQDFAREYNITVTLYRFPTSGFTCGKQK